MGSFALFHVILYTWSFFFGQITTANHTHIYVYLEWAIDNLEYTFSLCKRNKLALVLNDRIFGASLLIFWWYRIRYSIFAARFVFGIENPHWFKIHTDQTDIIAHCSLRRENNEVLFIVHSGTVSFEKSSFYIQVIAWSSVDFSSWQNKEKRIAKKCAKKCMYNISKWSKN